MKTIYKQIISSVAFIVILFILLAAVSFVFVPKNNAKKDGMEDVSANGILGEEENTIDVLFLGDSECYCSISPLQIFGEYGISSYVCATSAQKLCDTEQFLHKAFENQKPKLVVLEVNALYRNVSYESEVLCGIEKVLPIFKYHNRWKSLTAKDFSFDIKYTYNEKSKGYLYSATVKESKNIDYMKKSDEIEKIASKNQSYVKDILEFCKANGAELILISAPSTKNWNYMKHNAVLEFAKELNLEYIDMNLMPEEVPIDWAQDTKDKGDHLNYHGATKVTSYIGKYLADKNMFEDHRDEEKYDSWNTAYNEYMDKINKQENKKQ